MYILIIWLHDNPRARIHVSFSVADDVTAKHLIATLGLLL